MIIIPGQSGTYRHSRGRVTALLADSGQIDADHIDQLLIETAVIGELEGAHQMRLEPTSGPHTLHRRWAHPGRLGHRPAAPVRLASRLGLLGQPDDLVDLLRRDLRLTPPAGTNPTQLGQALLREATPPGHHTRRRDPD